MAEAEIIHKATGIFGMSLGQQALLITCGVTLYLVICWFLYKIKFLFDTEADPCFGRDYPLSNTYIDYILVFTIFWSVGGAILFLAVYAIYELIKFIICNW